MECRPCSSDDRGDHHVELFHHFQQFPIHATSRVQPGGDEFVGQRVHVLYIRFPLGVCCGQLRRAKTSQRQYGIHARRECGHPGTS